MSEIRMDESKKKVLTLLLGIMAAAIVVTIVVAIIISVNGGERVYNNNLIAADEAAQRGEYYSAINSLMKASRIKPDRTEPYLKMYEIVIGWAEESREQNDTLPIGLYSEYIDKLSVANEKLQDDGLQEKIDDLKQRMQEMEKLLAEKRNGNYEVDSVNDVSNNTNDTVNEVANNTDDTDSSSGNTTDDNNSFPEEEVHEIAGYLSGFNEVKSRIGTIPVSATMYDPANDLYTMITYDEKGNITGTTTNKISDDSFVSQYSYSYNKKGVLSSCREQLAEDPDNVNRYVGETIVKQSDYYYISIDRKKGSSSYEAVANLEYWFLDTGYYTVRVDDYSYIEKEYTRLSWLVLGVTSEDCKDYILGNSAKRELLEDYEYKFKRDTKNRISSSYEYDKINEEFTGKYTVYVY